MRIIGGKNQRKQIFAPVKLPVRPTTDMAKEALFNILNNYFDFEEISVLDLFAGTGNISYEFASRGAREVVSVDQNKMCTNFIKETADNLHLPNIKVIKTDVFHFLGFNTSQFNIVFADPPYDTSRYEEIIEMVFKNQFIAHEGWMIMEHSNKQKFNSSQHFFDLRRYGKVHFSFFK
ncbi:MAG: 16S rRNA (guanine(966)-N(2))-methyltransferase RsmD [Bacteroidota bacterium]